MCNGDNSIDKICSLRNINEKELNDIFKNYKEIKYILK
jgi:hypothetical protein